MGYPIRSNIFANRDNRDLEYYSRFPIQVAVLFSSSHPDFRDGFSEIFAHLDAITGDYVVFFAVLDPPNDWIEQARSEGRNVDLFQPLGVSFDDNVLVNELARLFQLQWAELPALVVSNDLWSTDFITASTSIYDVEKQLQSLVMLVRRTQDEVSLREIYDALIPVSTGNVFMQRNHRHNLRTDLFHFYNILDVVESNRFLNPFQSDQFQLSTRYMMRQSNEALFQLRSFTFRPQRDRVADMPDDDEPTTVDPELKNNLLAEAAGYLTAPASVVARANSRQNEIIHLDSIPLDSLEAESQAGIDQSIALSRFIKTMQSQRMQSKPVDYTPAAIGISKALELEVNYSVIQAARKSRGIRMPDYFVRYQPQVAVRVQAGNRTHDLNKKDNQIPDRHHFITLGDSWHVTKTMLTNPRESLAREVGRVPPDSAFFIPWEELYRLRNKGAHTNPLSDMESDRVFHLANTFDWSFLTRLKQALR